MNPAANAIDTAGRRGAAFPDVATATAIATDAPVIASRPALLCERAAALLGTEPEESMAAADLALQWLERHGDAGVDGPLRARALRYAGCSRVILGHLDEALPLLFEGMRVAGAARCDGDEAACMSAIGQALGRFGEFDSALTYLSGFLEKARQMNSAADVCRALINIGNVYVGLQDYPAALTKYREAEAAWRGDAAHKAILLNNAGGTLGKLGEFESAVVQLLAALAQLPAESPNRLLESQIRCNLGEACGRLGRMAEARAHLNDSLALAQRAGGRREALQAQIQLGRLALAEGHADEAETHLQAALQAAQSAGYRSVESEACELIARAFEAQGHLDRALDHHRRHARIEEELHRSRSERRARALQILLDFDLRQRQTDDAALTPPAPAAEARPAEPPSAQSTGAAERFAALPALTPRERQILGLVAKGLSNKEIAGLLSLSGYTVRHHVSAILRKLGARTRAQAVGMIPPDESHAPA